MDFLSLSDRHLLIWLNSNLTAEYRPLFEFIYCTEIFLIFFAYFFCPFLLISVWRASPLHVNIRLILMGLILHGVLGILSRIVLLYHQEYGRISQGTITQLTVASIVRDMLFANGTTVTFLIAADRFVATHYWAWYERQGQSTLSVALLLLVFAEIFSVTTACFSVFRVYSLLTHYLTLGAMQIIGSLFFVLVYRHNSDLMERYRVKFGVPDYSVARSYQIKENLVVIKVLYKIAVTTALLAPPFLLFGLYYATESLTCLELPRKMAIAIFDLSIAIFVVVLEFRLVTADERFQRGLLTISGFGWLRRRAERTASLKSAVSTIDTGDNYFMQFNKDWIVVIMDEVTTSFAVGSDVDELHEFMLDDFLREPSLNAAINLTREDATQCYRDVIEHCVASGVSTIQRNSEGRVVGFNLSAIVDHGEEEDWKSPTRIQLILDLLDALNENKWALIPADVSKLLYVEVVSVGEKYRKRGLAQKLLDLSYEKAREVGATGTFAECTSFPSQNLFAKTGYRVLREIRLEEFVGNEGKPVFMCPDGTTTAQLVFRRI